VEATASPAVVREDRVLAVAVPVGDVDAELLLKPCLLTGRERLGPGEDAPDRESTEEIFTDEVNERVQGAGIHVKKEWLQCPQPSAQPAEVLLCGRVWRDDPRVLETVEAHQAIMDVAAVDDSEVVWRVTHTGPDVEEIGALLLAARKRVGLETERLA